MLYIVFSIFLSIFFLPNAYGIKSQRDLMQGVLAELEKNEKFSSKQSKIADPEIIKKIENKSEFERLSTEIRESLNLGVEDLIANPDKITTLFYNFFNLFFDLSFLPFSQEIHFGKGGKEPALFDEFCGLHDAISKKNIDCNDIWIRGGFDKLDMEPLQEKLVVVLSLLSQTIGKYSDTKYEFLNAFKLSLIRALGSISESFPCFWKWGEILVLNNKFFKDPKYIFLSANKEFLAKEFERDLHLRYVIDAIHVDIVAETNKAKELQQRESDEKQRIISLKQRQYDELTKDMENKDISDLTNLCKKYIKVLCDPYFGCILKIVDEKKIKKIMESFNHLVITLEQETKKKIFSELNRDAEITFIFSVADEFIKACSKNQFWAFQGVGTLKKRLSTIKELIAQEAEKKPSGKMVVTLQDLQTPLLKKHLFDLKKALNNLKIKLGSLQSKLKSLSQKI